MTSRQSPTQSGANTPRSLGAFATLPRSNKHTPSGSIFNEPGPSSSTVQPIPITQPSSFFGNQAEIAFSPPPIPSPNQRGDEFSRSFRDVIPRSLGNDTLRARSRERQARQPLNREWTLFGQLLEEDGALGPRRASVAAGTSNRPRDSSRLRQQRPPTLGGVASPPAREQPPSRSRSSSRGHVSSRDAAIDPSNPSLSQPGFLFDDPSSGAELLSDSEADSLISGTTSITAGNRGVAHRQGRSSHPQEASYEPSSDSEHESDEHPSDSRPVAAPTAFSWLPSLTPSRKKVLKCSIAYTLGCLFTFVPALSGLLTDIVPLGSQQGPSPTGHMVATVGESVFQLSKRV